MAMEYFHQRYIRKVYKVRQTGFCLFVCLFVCFVFGVSAQVHSETRESGISADIIVIDGI